MTSENVLALIFAICFGADFEIAVAGGMIQKELVSRQVTSENVLALILSVGRYWIWICGGKGIVSKIDSQQANDIR